jgi:NAD-dependent DNA ligase
LSDFFVRHSAAYTSETLQSLAALLGIAQGMLCDRHLNDAEIRFLQEWLADNAGLTDAWPGSVVHSRVRTVLEDGMVTEPERQHLTATLQQLIAGTLPGRADSSGVSGLAFDQPVCIVYPQSRFCLTGEFVYAPPDVCAATIERRGGMISSTVTRKLNYLVVGGLGSQDWKPTSLGIKIEKALELKRDGAPIAIVHEDRWAASL